MLRKHYEFKRFSRLVTSFYNFTVELAIGKRMFYTKIIFSSTSEFGILFQLLDFRQASSFQIKSKCQSLYSVLLNNVILLFSLLVIDIYFHAE